MDEKIDEARERVHVYFEYKAQVDKALAGKGDWKNALELNQRVYENIYKMYCEEKENSQLDRTKIKKALKKIADDGQVIQILINAQLNNLEKENE